MMVVVHDGVAHSLSDGVSSTGTAISHCSEFLYSPATRELSWWDDEEWEWRTVGTRTRRRGMATCLACLVPGDQ